MKRPAFILFFLSLCLICFGCSSTPAEPQLRYDGSAAYYTQNGSKYTMEIQFAEPVSEGSSIALLLGEEEILSFTAEEGFSRLRLSSLKLELDQPYSLKVNGRLQRHGNSRSTIETTQPGYIPDPTPFTPPQEPMGDPVETAPLSDSTSDDSDREDSPFGTPPTIATDDLSIGSLPSLTETEAPDTDSSSNIGSTLPSQPFDQGREPTEAPALQPSLQPGGTTFTLTTTVTGFASVQNAS